MSGRRAGPGGFGRDLMQIAAAIVGSVGATQVVRPRCPVVSGPCPGTDRGAICSSPCQTTLPAETPRCCDPHCPYFGDPAFGEGTCPAEHAEVWRVRSQGGTPVLATDHPEKCGHGQVVFWSGAGWVHPMDMGVCDRPPA